MYRLLKHGLRYRGSDRIFQYDPLNLNFHDAFIGAFKCSSWVSSQPSSSGSSSAEHSAETKELHNVNKVDKERERIRKMRSRMRTLHGLDGESPADETLSQYQNRMTDDDTENDSATISFSSEPNDVVTSDVGATDEYGLARRQSDFIKRLQEGSLSQKKAEKLISAPFGLVRVDSMNSVQGRPQVSETPGETLGETENVQKSGLKSGQSIPKHNQSALKHSQLQLKDNEYKSVLKPDLSKLKHSEFELRYNQSTAKHVQSELRNDLPESYLEMKIGQKLNKTAQTTRNEMAAPLASFHGNHVQPQSLSQKKKSENPEPAKSNIFDQQYFGDCITATRNQNMETEKHSFLSDNVFEEQYFDGSSSLPERNVQLPEEVFATAVFSDIQNFPEEAVKRTKDIQANSRSSKSNDAADAEKNSQHLFDKQYFEHANASLTDVVETAEPNKVQPSKIRTPKVLSKLNMPDETEDTVFHETVTKREIRQRSIPIANIENPTTAYDMAMKIRLERKLAKPSTAVETHPLKSKWSGRVDSKGFRILTEQVTDMQRLTEDVVLNVLRDSILYEDDNIIAIDKPYGLPSHGGPGVHHSVGKFLEPLATKVDKTGRLTNLHLVHRLDKETTGVMVLAKSQQTAELLLAMFKKRMVVKRYWAITKGIPNPTEGIIDIPMAEGSVLDRYRMELRPVYSDETSFLSQATRSLKGGRREAVTNYKVLSSANCTALVECQPETGVKHQIRCHLAFGLNTPVLGDHKYSHYSKMVPQKLYPEILQRLGICQSKVRHLPMHLHARALVLPEFKDGRNLFLSARLPKHFIQNMKWLKLELPQ